MRVIVFTILLTVLFVPVVASAQIFGGPIVPCGGPDGPECNACQLVKMADNLIKFFVGMAVVVATLMFTWAGIKYATSGTKPDQISEAHKIFFNVLIGLIVVLGAWLIIDLILMAIPSEGTTVKGILMWTEVLCEE